MVRHLDKLIADRLAIYPLQGLPLRSAFVVPEENLETR